ncbi:hypothetical protein Lesp02_57280 [Lentzea sp. NBRC 105346]|uniref:nSTAND1 domain-containing NTPase n=1 Tax=Lentzea sp. NBRC 105346 TaxID=3032205 RepID=UPI0024A5D484|nr:hypothetical protein [Lentzea sp. NBRC 105346]GLZ33540.1 hypothetical protein Lesp02_57280 [Lentzea sp. NBRC 105346]
MPRRERPLDDVDTPLTRFAADLRLLRDKAGGPGYRELGRRAHYSAATLSDAAGGRKLPTLAVTLAYVAACGGDVAEWEARWRDLALELTPPAPPDLADAPYLGLAAFQAEHADRFFGRESLVAELRAKLDRHRFVAVFGASGAGKSSLLRAGLLPTVDGLLMTPGPQPMRELAVHVARHTGLSVVQVLADLEADPANLRLLLRDVVLVVDQFEEVFTLGGDPAPFITALLSVDRARVVIGVRTDFYTHCSGHLGLVEAMRDAQVTVGPMTVDELRQAITKPATAAGLNVDSALLAHLVAEANGRAGVLPLLSHALLETWRRRRGTTLTLNGFEAAGGIDGALTRTAEMLYATCADPDGVRRLFLRLTAPGEGTEDTKRRIDRSELDDDVPAALVDARLLTVDGSSVEITHESLIRSWPRLRDWLAEDRQALRVHRQLTDATAEWEAHDRDPGALYRGARLAVARELDRASLSQREAAFLDASLNAEVVELKVAKRQTRRTRLFAAALAVLLVAASVVAVVAVRQQRESESRALAARAQQNATTDVAGALKDSINAFSAAPTAEARSALIRNAGRPASQGTFPATTGTNPMAFAADGSLLAVSRRREIDLWDVPHRRKLKTYPLDGEKGAISLAFSPDKRYLAIGLFTGVIVWDVVSDRTIFKPDNRFPGVTRLAFTSDSRHVLGVGRRFSAITEESTVLRWDLEHPEPARVLDEITDATDLAVAGDTVVVSTTRGLSAWDLGTNRKLGELAGSVTSLAVSPDGSAVAFADETAKVMLADLRTLTKTNEFPTRERHLSGLAFADGGKLLAYASSDEIRFIDVHRWRYAGVLSAPNTESTSSLTAGSDGTIAAMGFDKISLWRLNNAPLDGKDNPIDALAFTTNGVSATSKQSRDAPDTSVLTWSLDAPLSPARTSHRDRVLGFDPTGTNIVVLVEPLRVEIRDARTGTVRTSLEGKGSATSDSYAFSRDGRFFALRAKTAVNTWEIATGKPVGTVPVADEVAFVFGPGDGRLTLLGRNGELATWDIAAGKRVGGWQTGVAEANELFFSGSVLAATRRDGNVVFWDPGELRELGTVPAHSGEILAAAISPDGALLATAGIDGKVNLWDTRTRELWATLPSTGYIGTRIAWRQDGTELAVADDNGITVWPISPQLAVRTACSRLDNDFSNDPRPMPSACS